MSKEFLKDEFRAIRVRSTDKIEIMLHKLHGFTRRNIIQFFTISRELFRRILLKMIFRKDLIEIGSMPKPFHEIVIRP